MGGWKYVVFWLTISFICGAWLVNKSIFDRKEYEVWQKTSIQLDKIITLLEK